jgi:hypothetical protein
VWIRLNRPPTDQIFCTYQVLKQWTVVNINLSLKFLIAVFKAKEIKYLYTNTINFIVINVAAETKQR